MTTMPEPFAYPLSPREILDLAPQAAKEAVATAGDELVDVVGDLASITRSLGTIKRSAQSELSDGDRGRRWEVSVGKKGNRTYSARLLSTLAIGDDTTAETVRKLMAAGVLRLEWHWTNLMTYANQVNTPITIAQREIRPDEAEFDVGVVWKDDYPSFTPIGEDQP